MPWIIQTCLLALVALAAIWDIQFRRIPNLLTASGVVAGFALNGFLFAWAGLRTAALGMALALAIYLPLYLLRGLGGGDVKLMAAVGAMVGAGNWLWIFVLTSLLGGVAAVILLLSRGRLRRALSNVGLILASLLRGQAPYANEELDVTSPKSMRLPHGVVIACGTLLFLLLLRLGNPR